jgi:hypothetical protein
VFYQDGPAVTGLVPLQIFRVLSLFKSSIVSYIVSYLGLGLVLGTELVLDLGLGSLSILFIVRY